MGSASDLPIMKAAADILKKFGISCELDVISAHRTPERAIDYAHNAVTTGMNVVFAGHGAHPVLPSLPTRRSSALPTAWDRPPSRHRCSPAAFGTKFRVPCTPAALRFASC